MQYISVQLNTHGQLMAPVLLDYSCAFDRVDHHCLLSIQHNAVLQAIPLQLTRQKHTGFSLTCSFQTVNADVQSLFSWQSIFLLQSYYTALWPSQGPVQVTAYTEIV